MVVDEKSKSLKEELEERISTDSELSDEEKKSSKKQIDVSDREIEELSNKISDKDIE